MGNNHSGQLGLGDSQDRNKFQEVPGLEKYGGAIKVKAGDKYSSITCKNGWILLAGKNEYGCFGLGHNEIQCKFVPVKVNVSYLPITPFNELLNKIKKEYHSRLVFFPRRKEIKFYMLWELAEQYCNGVKKHGINEKDKLKSSLDLEQTISTAKQRNKFKETPQEIKSILLAGINSRTKALLLELELIDNSPPTIEASRAAQGLRYGHYY